MQPERIAAVVLAAGASTRMGRNKLLLPIAGESVVRRAVRRAAAAVTGEVVVVVGHEADRVMAETARLRCRAVRNPAYARGMSSSLRAGLESLSPRTEAAVVVLADMPFVTAAMIAAVAERGRHGAGLVVSTYGDATLAPPILYHRRYFPELVELEGDGCGKRLLARHADEVVALPWPAPHLTDLDLPEDYERLRSDVRPE